MSGELHDLLSSDHERLDALLSACLRRDGTIDEQSYAELRRGLLHHIAIEEKVLFPRLQSRVDESSLRQQLHRDHAALAALLVPPPRLGEIGQIRTILEEHNPSRRRRAGCTAS